MGVRNLGDLFADIPPEMRPKHFDLPKGQSEFAVCRYFEDLAAANVSPSVSFLGAGFYAHYVPRAVDALSGRSEFYTSYTPYQAECSQGTLQAIFEYQTAVSRLLELGKDPAQLNREELLYVAQFAVTAASLSTQVPGGIPSIPDRAVVEQTMQELG